MFYLSFLGKDLGAEKKVTRKLSDFSGHQLQFIEALGVAGEASGPGATLTLQRSTVRNAIELLKI